MILFHGVLEKGDETMDSSLKLDQPLTSGGAARPVILLLEKNPVIAADMMGSFEAACACRVIHLTHAGEIEVTTFSNWARTIPWEVLCSITKRVPRLYRTALGV